MSIYNNNIFLKGNLGKPAEIVETKAGTVAKFSLAVYRSGKGEEAVTDWINCVAWHDLARGMAQLDKGARLIVVGSIITRSYEKEGMKRFISEIQARCIGQDIGIAKDDVDEFEDTF